MVGEVASGCLVVGVVVSWCASTLWCQLEDMFQLMGTPQGIEHVMVQITVTFQCFEIYRVS